MDTTSVHVTTARSVTSVAGARQRARDFLEGLVHPIAAEAGDSVVLVVSDLVTNALRHGGATWETRRPEPPWHRRAKRPPRPCDVVRTKACSRTMFPRLSSP
ncbi:hypothetical protein ACFWA5_39875 [Streptomyces mirabilis]|uniref:hypothetical protein n=1 Tax=Streptomyces mirabilis TaxID=68239 RepID=UPI003655F714